MTFITFRHRIRSRRSLDEYVVGQEYAKKGDVCCGIQPLQTGMATDIAWTTLRLRNLTC